MNHRSRRLLQLGSIVLAAGLAIALVVVLTGGDGGAKKAADPSAPVAQAAEVETMLAGIAQDGIALGRRDAPVTLVEFADLKCPICREYSLSVLPDLVQRYVRAGKLRIELRLQHFVGEQQNPGDSLAAAKMAQAAALQDKLWQFSELFYANQQDEATRYADDAFVSRIASAVKGLNEEKALHDRSSPKVTAALATADAQFEGNGFDGTPSFLLGRTGTTLKPLQVRSLTPQSFATEIDRALGAA